MENIINNILENKKIFRATPDTITLLEWYAEKNKLNPLDFYKNDSAKFFHQRSMQNVNSSRYYIDFDKSYIYANYKDGRYFDDIAFLEEKEIKPILVSTKMFLETQMPNIDEEIINKILFIINEVERNVRNHSSLNETEMLMSYCGNLNIIDNNRSSITINISDYGLGFEGRRNVNESYSILETQGINEFTHYVLNAIKPKISSHTNIKNVANKDGQNSGYGLYQLNQISSNVYNKLEILSDGKLFRNDYQETKMKFINEWKEMNGITSISFTFRISTVEEVFKKLKKVESQFSKKSQYSKSKII